MLGWAGLAWAQDAVMDVWRAYHACDGETSPVRPMAFILILRYGRPSTVYERELKSFVLEETLVLGGCLAFPHAGFPPAVGIEY